MQKRVGAEVVENISHQAHFQSINHQDLLMVVDMEVRPVVVLLIARAVDLIIV